jgi:hypothetical protein
MIDFLGKASGKCCQTVQRSHSIYVLLTRSMSCQVQLVQGQRISAFCLLLAINASGISNEFIFQTAEKLIEMGIVYLCAWGPDCERVHDDFAEAKILGERHIMTS